MDAGEARQDAPRDLQGYLDVSVPERPVAGESLNSQVEVENTLSTSP